MAFLSFALFAEGSTDHRFLSPLIPRVAIDLLLENRAELPDLGDVIPLTTLPGQLEEPRWVRIQNAALQARGAFHVLCVHADGGGAPARARAEQVLPGLEAAIRSLGKLCRFR